MVVAMAVVMVIIMIMIIPHIKMSGLLHLNL